MLRGVILAQKRASGCQKTDKIGRVRVLLSLETAHNRIADLVLAWPRNSSPMEYAKHKSREKIIHPSCLPSGIGGRTGDSSAFCRNALHSNFEYAGFSPLLKVHFQLTAQSSPGRKYLNELGPVGLPPLSQEEELVCWSIA